jgi:hypothetical protein
MKWGLAAAGVLLAIVIWLSVSAISPQRRVVLFGGSEAFVPSCNQSSTFIARTSGFTVSQERQYDSAICYLVSTGTLQKLDFLYRLAAPNQTVSLLNLVQNKYKSVLYGTIAAGQTVVGSSSLSGQTIVQQLSGTTGGVGTYQLSASATIASATNLLGNSSVAGVAPLFTAGGYYEVEMSYTYPGSGCCPSLWVEDLNGLYSLNLNTGYGAAAHFAEFDIFEGPSDSDTNVIDWTGTNGGGLGTSNRVYQGYPSITNPTAMHYYGMLWVPSTQNAGTGLIQFYLDRTHIPSLDVTYSSGGTPTPACTSSNPPGCLFIAESSNYVLLIDSGGSGYPVALANVNVWH